MLLKYLPALVLLAAGFVAARFGRIDRSGLGGLLHYVLIPAYLFYSLLGGVRDGKMLWLIGFGAAIAIAGILAVNAIHDKLNQRVDGSATIANIAVFAMPMLTLGGVAKNSNLRMALALAFIGMALGHVLFRAKGKGLAVIVRQPWFYAVIAAVLVRYGVITRDLVKDAAAPLARAAVAVSLLYLGTLLTSLAGLGRKDVWLTVLTRFAVGIVVALLFIKLAPIPRFMRATLLLAAMAPPATLGLAMVASGASDDSNTDAQLVGAGIFLTAIAYVLFPMYGKFLL